MNYICNSCQTTSNKWSGQCPSCEEWNTLEEQKVNPKSKTLSKKKLHNKKIEALPLSKEMNSDVLKSTKITTNIPECDRVLTGGITRDSVALISGQPGIGKSTLVLQICHNIGQSKSILYISGEESHTQVASRFFRLFDDTANIDFASTYILEDILQLMQTKKPDMIVIDSIQTLISHEIGVVPGTIQQVRYAADRLTELSKVLGIATIIVGHVTKDGNIGGPKTLEHIVDTVLLLEGERSSHLRQLRCLKNRFGVVDEVGLFEMKETGLTSINNPTEFLLKERNTKSFGTSLTVAVEGSRGFIIEIQALTNQSKFGYAKRSTSGFDNQRLDILIAIMQKYLQFDLAEHDVFVNIVGGFSFKDRSFDLAVIAAIISSYTKKVLDPNTLFIGEVGLTGEIRSSLHLEKRVKEASLLPKSHVITSKNCKNITELYKILSP